LLALAGLLVLFGGVFPLLRRIKANPASVAGQSTSAEIAASAGGGHARAGASQELRVRPEPALSSRSGSRDMLGIETETVRNLVAQDPARTAQVIKEWIARDRRSIKHAS